MIELSEFQIKFAPKIAINEQALADIVVESTCAPDAPPKHKE